MNIGLKWIPRSVFMPSLIRSEAASAGSPTARMASPAFTGETLSAPHRTVCILRRSNADAPSRTYGRPINSRYMPQSHRRSGPRGRRPRPIDNQDPSVEDRAAQVAAINLRVRPRGRPRRCGSDLRRSLTEHQNADDDRPADRDGDGMSTAARSTRSVLRGGLAAIRS